MRVIVLCCALWIHRINEGNVMDEEIKHFGFPGPSARRVLACHVHSDPTTRAMTSSTRIRGNYVEIVSYIMKMNTERNVNS